MVGYPKDVEKVYLGETDILASADLSTYLINMTTTSPQLAIVIDKVAEQKELRTLDASVSSGDVGAKKESLLLLICSPYGRRFK